MLDKYFTKEQITRIKNFTDFNDQIDDNSSLEDYLYTIIWVLWGEMKWKTLNFPFDIRGLQKNRNDLYNYLKSLTEAEIIAQILYLIDNNLYNFIV